jgi:hypothetical protein
VNSCIATNSVIAAAADQISCDLGEEAAILNLNTSVYYGLDPVGARIWRLLREPRTLAELRDAILSEYEVDGERCERDLLVLLERMREEGLIEIKAAAAGGV